MSDELSAADVQLWMKRNPDLARACQRVPELATLLEAAPAKGVSPSKYHSARTEAAGMSFQSGHEAAVVMGLVKAEEKGAGIYALRLQVRFPLAGGIVYTADAVFCALKDGVLSTVVLDAKAWDMKTGKFLLTPEFKLKRKLFRERYGIDITLA